MGNATISIFNCCNWWADAAGNVIFTMTVTEAENPMSGHAVTISGLNLRGIQDDHSILNSLVHARFLPVVE